MNILQSKGVEDSDVSELRINQGNGRKFFAHFWQKSFTITLLQIHPRPDKVAIHEMFFFFEFCFFSDDECYFLWTLQFQIAIKGGRVHVFGFAAGSPTKGRWRCWIFCRSWSELLQWNFPLLWHLKMLSNSYLFIVHPLEKIHRDNLFTISPTLYFCHFQLLQGKKNSGEYQECGWTEGPVSLASNSQTTHFDGFVEKQISTWHYSLVTDFANLWRKKSLLLQSWSEFLISSDSSGKVSCSNPFFRVNLRRTCSLATEGHLVRQVQIWCMTFSPTWTQT